MLSGKRVIGVVALVLLGGLGGWVWWRSARAPKPAYTSEGYGGFKSGAEERPRKPADPLQPVVTAYNAGRYKDAEAAAEVVVDKAGQSRSPARRKEAARAHYVMAFAAARRKNMKLARERFAELQKEAAKLPDKGTLPTLPGQMPLPTLEEDAAYQHAVCTAALGDKKGAGKEFIRFMLDHPESTLIRGAMQRIQRMNGGDAPPEAEAAWEKAVKTARERQKAREREESMCAPKCLAELLRRRGKKADVHALAEEMKTTEKGTTMQAFADVCRKHGIPARGFRLTRNGLLKQKPPMVALIYPGHFVIVDSVTNDSVTMWNPDAGGPGKDAAVSLPMDNWMKGWRGVTLLLNEPAE